jgi:hypothetical protein
MTYPTTENAVFEKHDAEIKTLSNNGLMNEDLAYKGKVIPMLQLSTTSWRRIGEWRNSSTHP